MPNLAIYIILLSLVGYLAAGVLFTVLFQLIGIDMIDEGVHGSSIGFRIIIIPGCILLWPVLMRRWIKTAAAKKPEHQSKPH